MTGRPARLSKPRYRRKNIRCHARHISRSAPRSRSPAPSRRALRNFGRFLGTAYQIYDDCVDIFGTEPRAGKSLGTDLARGKFTLPTLVYLESVPAGKRRKFVTALRDGKLTNRAQLRRLIAEQQALEQSLRVFERYVHRASAALECAGNQAVTRPLQQTAQFLVQQARALSVSAARRA